MEGASQNGERLNKAPFRKDKNHEVPVQGRPGFNSHQDQTTTSRSDAVRFKERDTHACRKEQG
jgi:hypothetical protein